MSRTSGSEGGPGRPTGRNPGTAPRSDSYDWAKHQAAKAGIRFTALSNGFASCDQPERLQAICDTFGPERRAGVL